MAGPRDHRPPPASDAADDVYEPTQLLTEEEIASLLTGEPLPGARRSGTGLDRRQASRVDVQRLGSTEIGGEPLACIVADVSTKGALILCKNEAPDGGAVTVTIEGVGSLRGTIAWRNRFGMGVKWNQDGGAVQQWLAALNRH